jgi:hypothetical protein
MARGSAMNAEIVAYPAEATIMKRLKRATSGDGSRFPKVEDLSPPGLQRQNHGYCEARKRYTINATFPANAFRKL